ncbi:hypothetical protein C7G41_10605 [Bradyrhizobium sp. MOS002]|nr:hypothetical protein C7G41_10605 [Bradyrhizobium sp. MOS002]
MRNVALSAAPPSLRAQRSNPDCHRGKTLDCFAALAMTSLLRRARVILSVSYPAEAGYPVRCGFTIQLLLPRNTGSPGQAGR